MPQFRNVGNMPAPSSPPLCCHLAPHIFLCDERVSKPKKPTPGSSTIGKKPACVCPHPGRLDGDAGPSGGNGGDDEQPRPRRAHALMINSSGFYDYKPRKGGRQTCKAEAYTPFRSPPPPPPPPGRSSVPVVANSSGRQSNTARQSSQSMSTLQRMLTPPVSDTNSPSKKRTFEEFRVSYYGSNAKTKPNKEHSHSRWIKCPPVKNQLPDPEREVRGPFLSRRDETKQERFRDNSLPCIVEDRTDNDADDSRETSPASSDSGLPDADTEAQAPKSMSTFQRMLSPPVSEFNSPPKKQDVEPVQVFMFKDNSKTQRDWVRGNQTNSIKHPPCYPKHPNPDKRKVGGFNQTHEATKQKHSNGPKKDARSSGSTLTAATPPPDSDHDVQDDNDLDSDTRDVEDAARLRRTLSPPVADDNSPLKQQPSDEFRVFYNSGNRKTKPNKDHHLDRTAIRQPPSQNQRSDPDKQKEIEFLARQQKIEERRKRKAKARRDQRLNRPSIGSSNDADREDNGTNSPVRSNTRSSSSTASQAFFTPPTTPTRPITRSRSKQLADEAQEQATDNQYPSSPSISPPSVKRKRGEGYYSQPTSPVSPLSQRSSKRLRGSQVHSPMVSPSLRSVLDARRES
jgi:hypothetical protein